MAKMGGPRRRQESRTGRPAQAREASPGHGVRRWLTEWMKTIGSALVLFLFIRTFVLQTFGIISGSMENTLLVGDFLLLSKAAYGAQVPGTPWRTPGYERPDRGDIVVFRGPHAPDLDLVKRLVGLPGDTLAMRDGVLYLNGQRQDEPYLPDSTAGQDVTHPWMTWQVQYLVPGADASAYRPTLNNWGPIVVPPDKFFMMGDNRDDSLDSRYWGFADRSKVKGRALVIYFSFDPQSGNPFPWIQDVRWRRIGHGIK